MMRPKSWSVLSDALDEGLAFALNRVLEELPRVPSREAEASWREPVIAKMKTEVLNAICERFHFDDPEGE